jgi:hypothetical protein
MMSNDTYGTLITRDTKSTPGNHFLIVEGADCRNDNTTVPIRNPNLFTQWDAIRNLKVPIGLHITLDPLWYAQNVRDMNDDTAWPLLRNDPSIKQMSWVIGEAGKYRKADFLVIACRQRANMPDAGWLYAVQERVSVMAYEAWSIPHWCEFDRSYLANKIWDKGLSGETYMARLVEISMRQLQSSSVAEFEMFTLKKRDNCLWRFGSGLDSTISYKFYGDLAECLGLSFEATTPPVVLPTETPVTRAEFEALKAMVTTNQSDVEVHNKYADEIRKILNGEV